jgi:uncharacterized protein YnzC (UPF0291/DUF896 family)
MSDDVAVASEASAPAVVETATPEAPKSQTPKEALLERIKEFKAKQKAEREAPAAATEPAKGEAEAQDEPAAEEPTKGDKDIELAYAKLQRKWSDAQDEIRTAREFNKKLETEHKGLLANMEAAKGDPARSLELFEKLMGRSFGDYSKWIVENADRVKERRAVASLPEEYRAELELARKEREERLTEKQKAEQTAALTSYSANVSTYLKDNADDFPLASSLGWAAAQLAEQHGVGKVRPEHIKQLETTLEANLLDTLTESTLRHLIGKHANLKTLVTSIAGATAAKPSPVTASPKGNQSESAEGPRTLSNSNTSASVVSAVLSGKDATKAKLMEGLAKIRAANSPK